MRHRRYICLYSPAVVVGVWAVVFGVFDRTDLTVILGFACLSVSLMFFAHQLIQDFKHRDRFEQELTRERQL